VARSEEALEEALLDKAKLLHSQALLDRLAQGKGETFIGGLLAKDSPEALVVFLCEELTGPDTGKAIALLQRYLKKINVRQVYLADFRPSKRTLEASDVDQIVGEFRDFLEDELTADADELPIIELE
jgi:hypothetical protein